ncbi:hypothetical protein COLSTE_00231 [Collinsella stercoris DSM 13279]|uniref:Uncharacterized protein n=1 Tax=Collinsella stercoris DSM 13279 TaxID=445975 RepID=B6G841_9ACTN|nr:hypothetical protein COLSTE_00231 [Collinsella stercoris DSM 13279]
MYNRTSSTIGIRKRRRRFCRGRCFFESGTATLIGCDWCGQIRSRG